MSAWCALFVTQATLITVRRIDLHRQLGVLAALVAPAAVVLAAYVTVDATAREVRAHVVGEFHMLFGFNLLDLLLFVSLLSAALLYRRAPPFHRRLMLLAMLALLPPAIARATLLITTNQAAQMWAVDAVVLGCVLIDTARSGRLHPAFGWGAAGLLIPLNAAYVLFQTDQWNDFVTHVFS